MILAPDGVLIWTYSLKSQYFGVKTDTFDRRRGRGKYLF